MVDSRNSAWFPFVWNSDVAPNMSKENTSIDVMRKNCFQDFDSIACARSSLLALISTVTAVLCIWRLVKFHILRGSNMFVNHHIVLFYVAVIHCLLGTTEWIIGTTTYSDLVCLYLRSLELLIVCHFYLTLVSKVFHCAEEQSARYVVAGLSVLFVYFTTFVVVGAVYSQTVWFDCYASFWLYIVVGQLLAVQMLILTSYLICRKISQIAMEESLKNSQKRDLLCLIVCFELSAMINLAYHVTLYMLAGPDEGCSGVFHHKQLAYSAIITVVNLTVVLLPIWSIIWVFRPKMEPVERNRRNSSINSISGELIDPAFLPPRSVANWRYRRGLPYRRLIQGGGSADDLPALLGYRRSGMRRTHSAPTFTQRRPRFSRNGGSLRGGPASVEPDLAPIPEASREGSQTDVREIDQAPGGVGPWLVATA